MTAPIRFSAVVLSAAVLSAAALIFASSVFASGGGGTSGGSSTAPSVSAPQYDPAVEFQNGVDALKESRFKDAERAFDRVLSGNPRHAKTNFLAGLARAGQNNSKGARRYYEKAVKYDDNLIVAHQELALTSIKLGETEKAKSVLGVLKQRSDACAGTCAQAADLQTAVSKIESALAPASSETSANPSQSNLDDFIPKLQFGDQAYMQAVALINEHRYQDAIVQLESASQTFGPHPDILTYLGFVHRKLGHYALAESYYRQALSIAPRHIGATEYYGELMVERGDLRGARRMLSKLESYCDFGCAEADELRRWIVDTQHDAS